jgi:hypothetical protein
MAQIAHVTGSHDVETTRVAPTGLEVGTAAVVGIAVVLISWFRMPPSVRGTIWAEDGRNFLGDALLSPPLTTIFRPYDGYLHLVPRLAGEAVAAVVPPLSYPQAMAAISCLVAGAVASLVFVLARPIVPSVVARIGLGLVTALVPALPIEVLGNMANVHWYFLWLAPWLLLYRPRTRRSGWLCGLVALTAALTEAQMIYFVPLVAWRWRDRAYWPVRAGLLLGLAAQVVAYLIAPRSERSGAVADPDDILAGFLVNAVMTVWVGSIEAIADVVARVGWAATLLPVAIIVSCSLVLVLRGRPMQRAAAVTLLAGGLLGWVVPVVLNRRRDFDYSRPEELISTVAVVRYAVVPSMFLLAIVILGLAVLAAKGWPQRVLALVVVGWVVFIAVANFDVFSRRENGPLWSAEVDAGRELCLTSESRSVVYLAVAPHGWGTLPMPCALLRQQD